MKISSTLPRGDDADVVIVGAGTAGSVLAARLSEDPGRRVLLLEAGPDTPPGAVPADIADTFPRSYSNPAYAWSGLRASIRDGDAARPYTQARVMGGGSSLMGMWALRGLAADYERWCEAGAEGWGWDDVRPCFEHIESDPLDAARTARGPVPLRRVAGTQAPQHVQALERAANAIGIASHPNINATEADGFFAIPLSQTDSERVSAASAYLTQAVRARPNLRVLSDAEVLRVDFDGARVRGVTVRRGGATNFHAAGEVIVCAGAIHSPALLLRSGIGPADELRALGLPVVADLPGVGRNLQNHVCVNLGLSLPAAHAGANSGRDYGVACVRTSSGLPGGAPADLLLALIGRTSMRAIGARIGLLNVFLYDPLSRGSVTLRANGDALQTQVDFNILSHAADSARMAHGLELALQLLRAPACDRAWLDCFMLPPAAPLHRLNRPGLLGQAQGLAALAAFSAGRWTRRGALSRVVGRNAFMDPRRAVPARAQLEALCIENATPMFHVAGTCAMGDADHAATVVDADCRVRGVEGLRVADASVMPRVPRANTYLPTLMIGEHAAQRIRRGARPPTQQGETA